MPKAAPDGPSFINRRVMRCYWKLKENYKVCYNCRVAKIDKTFIQDVIFFVAPLVFFISIFLTVFMLLAFREWQIIGVTIAISLVCFYILKFTGLSRRKVLASWLEEYFSWLIG